MFDELKAIGLDAFTKKHDPYWDIPLNENLPQPVIDLPGFGPAGDDDYSLDTTPRLCASVGGKGVDQHEYRQSSLKGNPDVTQRKALV